MTRRETAHLLGMCAAYDARTVGEADVVAWHAALHDVVFADAQAAVVAHYRDTRDRVMPADVRRLVKAAREDRLMRHPIDAPDADPDDRRYRAELHARITRVASGLTPPAELPPPVEPTSEYQATWRERGEDRVRVLAVACPWTPCRAAAGQPCVDAAGKPLRSQPYHDARQQATDDTAPAEAP